jgi:uncharacterized protein YdbL (DUF1318 family)
MSILTIGACVTINVYFPEAAAEEAAERFIDDVIGEGPENVQESSAIPSSGRSWQYAVLDLLIPAAHAQANISISTPAIKQIQARMTARFESELSAYFSAGAIGLTSDGLVSVRDLSKVGLKDRNRVSAAVKADNNDRLAVYREIAVANGHPEWEQQIRNTFAREWVDNAQAGWFYQDSQGNWKQK